MMDMLKEKGIARGQKQACPLPEWMDLSGKTDDNVLGGTVKTLLCQGNNKINICSVITVT